MTKTPSALATKGQRPPGVCIRVTDDAHLVVVIVVVINRTINSATAGSIGRRLARSCSSCDDESEGARDHDRATRPLPTLYSPLGNVKAWKGVVADESHTRTEWQWTLRQRAGLALRTTLRRQVEHAGAPPIRHTRWAGRLRWNDSAPRKPVPLQPHVVLRFHSTAR